MTPPSAKLSGGSATMVRSMRAQIRQLVERAVERGQTVAHSILHSLLRHARERQPHGGNLRE
jgi:hypothetical protein